MCTHQIILGTNDNQGKCKLCGFKTIYPKGFPPVRYDDLKNWLDPMELRQKARGARTIDCFL